MPHRTCAASRGICRHYRGGDSVACGVGTRAHGARGGSRVPTGTPPGVDSGPVQKDSERDQGLSVALEDGRGNERPRRRVVVIGALCASGFLPDSHVGPPLLRLRHLTCSWRPNQMIDGLTQGLAAPLRCFAQQSPHRHTMINWSLQVCFSSSPKGVRDVLGAATSHESRRMPATCGC